MHKLSKKVDIRAELVQSTLNKHHTQRGMPYGNENRKS
jgi:hypothetical protein